MGGREFKSKNLENNDIVAAWSSLVNGSLRVLPSLFNTNKKKKEVNANGFSSLQGQLRMKRPSTAFNEVKMGEEGKQKSFECFIGYIFEQLALNLLKFSPFMQQTVYGSSAYSNQTPWFSMNLHGFQRTIKFAKVGDLSSRIVDAAPSPSAGFGNHIQQMGSKLPANEPNELSCPSTEHPDMKKLMSALDFYKYTLVEGRSIFEELDRDGDGEVTLEDLETEMKKRKLPIRFAKEFMNHSKRHLFSKSFGWKQFCSLMKRKEPAILQAFTSLNLNESGTLKNCDVMTSLKHANLPASEEDVANVMRFFEADIEGSISYRHFRNYMLLLPFERLQDDPQKIWIEAATAAVASTEAPTESVLRSALAGGLSCAFSSFLMHPLDTVKTRVQASTVLSFPQILSKLPDIGIQGLYKGSVPTVVGQFSSHGLRTGLCEASKMVLINVTPNLQDIQVETLSSLCSTILGTVARIPCEVLKQRLQAGIFDNIGEAVIGTWQQDGIRGFFRGTGATLCREIPFYVAGMALYNESKKAVQKIVGRELEPWETVLVGAVSGGLASVTTTPFDVIKTRMMTEIHDQSLSMSMVGAPCLVQRGSSKVFLDCSAWCHELCWV